VDAVGATHAWLITTRAPRAARHLTRAAEELHARGVLAFGTQMTPRVHFGPTQKRLVPSVRERFPRRTRRGCRTGTRMDVCKYTTNELAACSARGGNPVRGGFRTTGHARTSLSVNPSGRASGLTGRWCGGCSGEGRGRCSSSPTPARSPDSLLHGLERMTQPATLRADRSRPRDRRF